MENAMKSIVPLVSVVASLVLLLTITPSWGQPVCVAPGCNPTMSDPKGNTAGGSHALRNVVSGQFGGLSDPALADLAPANTPFGFGTTASGAGALVSNSTGSGNTASGVAALASNTSGVSNTAIGVDALASNTIGGFNTASGVGALSFNTTGNN